MNKTDKEYVDAQIESVEEKFEASLKEDYEKVSRLVAEVQLALDKINNSVDI